MGGGFQAKREIGSRRRKTSMRKQKWTFRFLAVLSVASLLISSCTQTSPTLPADQPAQAAAGQTAEPPAVGQPHQGGTVTEAVFADVKNLNPIFNSDYGSGRIIDRVFEGTSRGRPEDR